MLKNLLYIFLFAIIFNANPALAHFGFIKPSSSMIINKNEASISIDIAFIHPFMLQGMNMPKPKEFLVFHNGIKQNITNTLQAIKFLDHDAWHANFQIQRPGVYQFAVLPEPYFEETEDCFIMHYSKTVIAAFGTEDGWDVPIGLPIEIIPLTRPFANYSGNVFQGKVVHNGKPLANIEVEIEYYNENGKLIAPNELFYTQVVKTDANGIFTYGIPWSGWWGFSALTMSADKIDRDGQAKDVELGAVIWLDFTKPLLN